MKMTQGIPEASWISGLERATGSSSSTEAWEGRVDSSGRLFYIETPPEPSWDEIKVVLPIGERRGVNLGRKAGLSERLLGLRIGRGGSIETILTDSDEQLVKDGDVIRRVEGIPVQDRAGIEMTLSGLPSGAQTVRLHVLRRSLKVEQAEQTPLKQPPDFPHQLLYFQPGAREAYKYPESPPAPISGAFPTLYDALDNSFNSGASATSITFDGHLLSVSFVQLASGGLLCVAVSAAVVPFPLIRQVVDQLRVTVAAEFGHSTHPETGLDFAIDRNRDLVDGFFNRFFHSLRAEAADRRALSLPRLTLVPESVKVELDTILYRFEAYELEDGAYIRTHHIMGSALFSGDSVICSHFRRFHLELVFLLLRQERVFSGGDVARIIIWRPIHLPVNETDLFESRGTLARSEDIASAVSSPTNFLLVVSRGPHVLAAILEVNGFCVSDGNPSPDPFLVDWADENLTIAKNVLGNVTPIVLKDYLVLDEGRGFYVAEGHQDNELWTLLRRRKLANCLMTRSKDGSYICCQIIDGVVVVSRQNSPPTTIQAAVKALRSIEL